MNWQSRFLTMLVSSLALSSCVSWFGVWTVEDRGAESVWRASKQKYIERFIPVRLNPYNPVDGDFDLYYFVHEAEGGNARKTVLFISGGPGEYVIPVNDSDAFPNFLRASGYNVVYFHLRGAGLSQIPRQNNYDRFLTTSYAVEDVEEIRQDLIRQGFLNDQGKWDAIIAWSYGTVLAQQYAFAHESSVEKLVLFGPLSTHNVPFKIREFRDETLNILRETLDKIYGPTTPLRPGLRDFRREEFFDLTPKQKDYIFEILFGKVDERGTFQPGVVERAENAFGSIQFIMDRYDKLSTSGELHRYDLQQYSCSFFAQLRRLRFTGWLGDRFANDEQTKIGARIRDEINRPSGYGKNDCSTSDFSSRRVFYSMGTLDRLNQRFLREWINNGYTDVRDALRKSAGDAHLKRGVNDYVERLGITDTDMVASFDEASSKRRGWDPANYKHRRPALILKGLADPVTAGNQAERFFEDGLLGSRTLIAFPGIGHEFRLPETSFQERLSGTISLQRESIMPGQVKVVAGRTQGLKLNKALRLELFPPHDLENGLKLNGFGRVLGKAPNNRDDDIVVLIENSGGNNIQASKKWWRIENEFFSALVLLDPGIISSRETKLVYGKIVQLRLKERYRLRVGAPQNWPLTTKLLCYEFVNTDKLEMIFFNDGIADSRGQVGRWSIRNALYSTEFLSATFERVLPPGKSIRQTQTVPPINDISSPLETRWALNKIRDFDACVPDRRELAAILQREVPFDMPLIVKYTGTDTWTGAVEKNWIIENPMFTIAVSANLPDGISDGNVRFVDGTASVTFKEWLRVREAVPGGNFDILGYNVEDDSRMSLVLQNRQLSVRDVGEDSRDWFYSLMAYADVYSPGEPATCVSNRTTRDCLIFSFLVMDPIQFGAIQTNPVLSDINERFKKEQLKIDPQQIPGGISLPNRF